MRMRAHITKLASERQIRTGQQKFRFEISETASRAQWNGTFRLYRPKPQPVLLRTQNYSLKEKSKYCLYPKEHSTVAKGPWKTKGGGILFRVESL